LLHVASSLDSSLFRSAVKKPKKPRTSNGIGKLKAKPVALKSSGRTSAATAKIRTPSPLPTTPAYDHSPSVSIDGPPMRGLGTRDSPIALFEDQEMSELPLKRIKLDTGAIPDLSTKESTPFSDLAPSKKRKRGDVEIVRARP
jgi:hypothetical protein